MEIRPIRNDDDHREALIEIDRLWNAPKNTPDGDKLDVLATLVEVYEANRWPVRRSTPREILEYAISDMGHTQKELSDLLGSRSQASNILRGHRGISLETARKISSAWNIPIQLLITPYANDKAA